MVLAQPHLVEHEADRRHQTESDQDDRHDLPGATADHHPQHDSEDDQDSGATEGQDPGSVAHTALMPTPPRREPYAELAAAKARLDPLALYDRAVRIDRVRLLTVPWLFRLPWFRRFDGYTMWNLILLRAPELAFDEELICHELCHVWQMQHHPIRMPLSYLRHGYARNPYEQEARRASADQHLRPTRGDDHEHAPPGALPLRPDRTDPQP
jgi:hypothetical protein